MSEPEKVDAVVELLGLLVTELGIVGQKLEALGRMVGAHSQLDWSGWQKQIAREQIKSRSKGRK